MGQHYDVTGAEQTGSFQNDYGVFDVWTATFTSADGASIQAEVNRKTDGGVGSSSPPESGEYDYTPSNSGYLGKMKRVWIPTGGGGRGNGGGTWKPRPASEIAGARRAHSQLVAASIIEPLPNSATPADVKARLDLLRRVAERLDADCAVASEIAEKDAASAAESASAAPPAPTPVRPPSEPPQDVRTAPAAAQSEPTPDDDIPF